MLIPKEHELFILIADIKGYSFHVIFVIISFQQLAAKEPSHDFPPQDLHVIREMLTLYLNQDLKHYIQYKQENMKQERPKIAVH